ncbi:MAG: tetratricopeptide repeat protein [Planctomycetota bacterium]|nr:tetratricopeptide repeat protein [Planctomycetota bacterium]
MFELPETWLAEIGGRDASGWLTAFAQSPRQAVADLLWDRFYFGPLNLTDRGQLLAGWLERLGAAEGFADRLDAELAGWIVENWGRFDAHAESLASVWSCACSVVEYSARLPREYRLVRSAAALRERFAERHSFLGSFSTAPAADPLGLYLAVVAEFQGDDRSLAGFWHRLCDLPDGVPFYHARYALLGLRRLKAEDSAEDGTLRTEIVLGLLRLARAFDRLNRERGLTEYVAKATFRRVAAQTAAAYRESPRWAEHGLAETRELPERVQRWVLDAIPPLADAMRREMAKAAAHRHWPRRPILPDPTWAQRVRELADAFRHADWNRLPDAERLLQEQRSYAEATGDAHNIVRSLRNFATKITRFRPDLAERWAEEARVWAPHDPWSWTTIQTVLVRQRKSDPALRYAWVAWKRFAENVVVRSGLADLLKSVERYDEAEAVYRETIDLFPEDVVARNGLAEVLKATRQYDEAEVVYRETIDLFPDNVFARTGLADTLRRARRYEDAEAEFRRSIDLGYVDTVTFVGLAHLVLHKDAAHRAEALQLVSRALEMDPRSSYARSLKQKLQSADEAAVAELVRELDQMADAEPTSPAGSLPCDGERWEESFGDVVESRSVAVPPSPQIGSTPAATTGDRPTARVAKPEKPAKPVAAGSEPRKLSTDTHPSQPRQAKVDPLAVEALAAEAYFFRTWAGSVDGPVAAARRQKAASLLDQAAKLTPLDPQVVAEQAALDMAEGRVSEANQRLTQQLGTHPAAAPLLILKARLERETAHQQSRPLTDVNLSELCRLPQRLRDLSPAFTPLFHLQRGLAALALVDGAARVAATADAFSDFRRTLARRAGAEREEREASPDRQTRETPRFHEWMQSQANRRLFAELPASETVDKVDVPSVERVIGDRRRVVEEMEDAFAGRLTVAMI